MRLSTLGSAAVLVTALIAPASANAIKLGEIAPAGTVGSGNTVSYIQQSSVGQPGYSVPAAGTITNFAIRSGNSHDSGDFVRLLVLRPQGGSYTVIGESDPLMLSGQPLQARLGMPVTIAVSPGDLIGGQYTFTGFGNGPIAFGTPNAGDLVRQIATFPFTVGDTVTASDFGSSLRLNMEVDFQYADAFAPEITAFKARYKSFRLNTKGLVISKRPHPGTTISLNLSESAGVTFTVEKGFKGKSVGGTCVQPTAKNAKTKSCTRWVFVHQFKRSLVTGPNSFSYSALYVSPNNGKVGTLRPGPYRMRADATDTAGNAGSATPLRFRIRK